MGRKKIYEDRKKYIADWTNANCDRLDLKVPKGEKAVYQGFAKHQNTSVTTFIRVAVQKHMDEIYNEADNAQKEEIDKLIEHFTELQTNKDSKKAEQ